MTTEAFFVLFLTLSTAVSTLGDRYTVPVKIKHESDKFCTKDSCLKDDWSERKDKETYESLPASIQDLFLSEDEMALKIISSGKPGEKAIIFPHKETERGVNVVGGDKILRDYPQYSNRVRKLMTELPGDAHRTMTVQHGCCPEIRYFTHPPRMRNIAGQERELVHFERFNPPKYQFTFRGTCALDEGSPYSDGHCRERSIDTILLVYDKSGHITFDVFSLPSYCKCLMN